MGAIPLAPHLLMTQYLDDDIPSERKIALAHGLALYAYAAKCGCLLRAASQVAWLQKLSLPKNTIYESATSTPRARKSFDDNNQGYGSSVLKGEMQL